MNKVRKGVSWFFKSFNVKGDKIIIHKSVINESIKRVKNDMSIDESGDRVAGRLDVLNDLADAITIGQRLDRNKNELK